MSEELTASRILHSLPERLRVDKAGDFEGRFHFQLQGEGGGEFTVVVSQGQCRVEEGLKGEPDCIVKAGAKTYVNIETGQTNPQAALMMGKINVSNLSAMMQFSKLFRRLPTNSSESATAAGGGASEQEATRRPQQGPLQGTKIVDLTRLLPGPLATMLMADMGAEVIKVEDPNAPDYVRNFPPFANGESVNYLALNRSKRSMAVDLYQEKGRNILIELAKKADVLVEQFRPGVMQQMGLDYETLAAHNPKLVYVSISGYGQDGPYQKQAGHDLNYISISGLLAMNVDENGKPVIPGFQVADTAGGSYMAVNATMAALLSRQNTGRGQHVDVAMMDGVMPLMSLAMQSWHQAQQNITNHNMQLAGAVANYNVYECRDGRFVALGALEPKFWQNFCQMIGRPDWEQKIAHQTKEDKDELINQVQQVFKTKRREEWLQLARDYDCCLSPVNTLPEAQEDPQIRHRQMIREQKTRTGETYNELGTPIVFSNTPNQPSWQAPSLGEDTVAIARELGYSEETIHQLKDQGVLG